MSETKRRARIAGLLYLLQAVTAPFGLLVVPNAIFVAGDPTATAERLRQSESFFRLGIASELFHQALAVFIVLALFRLFRSVSETAAWHMVFLSLTGVPVMFANVFNEIAALLLAKGGPGLAALSTGQRDTLAYLFMRLHSQGTNVASLFWGLWLFPFGWLVVRSRFIPRIFGYLLYVAGLAYVVSCFTTILSPSLASRVNPIAMALFAAELPIIFWLAIWGAREPRPGTPPPA
jgi:hypothetical protein